METSKSKKVVVIGAGLTGIAAVKELVEIGLDVVCYEQRQDIGGVFSDMGSYDSVLLTVSSHFMAYSDFMPYDEDVHFWTRAEYKAYLDRYVEHFNLRERINFGWRLIDVFDPEGNCTITLANADGEKITASCDHLVICSGQFQTPNIPEIPGIESFPGETLHSSNYSNLDSSSGLAGKRVLFFGLGESGADVVTEIFSIAGESVLSLRRPHVFSQRLIGDQMPIDVNQHRMWHCLPSRTKASAVRKLWQGVRKRNPEGSAMAILGDHMANSNSLDEPGSVVTKTERVFEAFENGLELDIGGVERVEGNQVFFKSGRVQEFDAIVYCTGFKLSLPFLPQEYQFSDVRDLYLQAFHPMLREKVSFLGFCRPQQGGVPLMAEMLSRYLALVLMGSARLPADLAQEAANDKARWRQEFYETPDVPGLVNGLRYNEKLARLIGCRMSPPNWLFAPRKFYAYWNFHIWPCQYRQLGPGARAELADSWLAATNSHKQTVTDLSLSQCWRFILGYFSLRLKTAFKSQPGAKWRPC